MPWRKNRPIGTGELEFHLPVEPESSRHDDEWLEKRFEKIQNRHHR